jgi:hypothetical protein
MLLTLGRLGHNHPTCPPRNPNSSLQRCSRGGGRRQRRSKPTTSCSRYLDSVCPAPASEAGNCVVMQPPAGQKSSRKAPPGTRPHNSLDRVTGVTRPAKTTPYRREIKAWAAGQPTYDAKDAQGRRRCFQSKLAGYSASPFSTA